MLISPAIFDAGSRSPAHIPKEPLSNSKHFLAPNFTSSSFIICQQNSHFLPTPFLFTLAHAYLPNPPRLVAHSQPTFQDYLTCFSSSLFSKSLPLFSPSFPQLSAISPNFPHIYTTLDPLPLFAYFSKSSGTSRCLLLPSTLAPPSS